MEEDENIELEFPTFSMDGMEDGDEFATHYRKEIAEAVHLAVVRMLLYELDEVPVFMVAETDSVFMLDRDSMPTAVDGCIEYYKEIEAYEICADLTQLKSEL
jgi:hypothetical protein